MSSRFINYREPLAVKLNNDELDKNLKALNMLLEHEFGCTVEHVDSSVKYKLVGSTIINQGGKHHYGVVYVPEEVADNLMSAVSHTRPLHEFIDGRFVEA